VFPEKTGLPVTGVVDEQVQAVQTADAFFDLSYFVTSGEFCNDDLNRGAIHALQVLGTIRQCLLPASVENEITAFLGESMRKGCSDSAGSSSYESTWSVM
jgi:hypothetical protein